MAGRKLSPVEIAEKIMRASSLGRARVYGTRSRDPERCEDIVVELDLPQSEIDAAFKITACSMLAPWEVPRKWIGKS